MRWARILITTLIIAVLQVSFMGALRIGGAVPNVLLVLVVSLVVWGTASEALLSAVWGGLLLDIAGGGMFGLAMSSLVVICLGLVALRQLGVDGHAWPTRVGMVALASVTWSLIHVSALGLSNLTTLTVWRLMVMEICINCLISLVYTERWVHGSRTV